MRRQAMFIGAAAMALAMGGVQMQHMPMTRPEPPRIRVPEIVYQGSRKDRLRNRQKHTSWQENRKNAERRREASRSRRAPHASFHAAVNALTNHERNRWARAGYPGLSNKDPNRVRAFKEAA